jgi:hypothetical protein
MRARCAGAWDVNLLVVWVLVTRFEHGDNGIWHAICGCCSSVMHGG